MSTTPREYRKFRCTLCGGHVFLPPADAPTLLEPGATVTIELTCSKGHSDSYVVAQGSHLTEAPHSPAELRRSVASVG